MTNGVRRRRNLACDVEGDDVGAVDRHLHGDCTTHAPRGAGYDNDLVLQKRASARPNRSSGALRRRLWHRLSIQKFGCQYQI
jgi:hypothetical protein